MTDLDSILKSRDITLLTKACMVKAMVFLVDMYRYESWTIRKVEYQRIDAFKLWNAVCGWLVFAIAAATYLLTMEPTASFWDCGEFIVSAHKLDVGQP